MSDELSKNQPRTEARVRPRNPSAFPSDKKTKIIWQAGNSGQCETIEPEAGMTLRDYFAAKALQGIITTSARPYFIEIQGQETAHLAAKHAYCLADAMLAARLSTQEGGKEEV